MIKPSIKKSLRPGETTLGGVEPMDAAALAGALRDVQAKLEAVTLREQEYRVAMTRLEDEVRAAGALQRALLPVELPPMVGADVRVLFQPHSAVSGDVYDVFRLDEARVGLTLADATGHGMPAALLSTMIRRTLRHEPGAGDNGLDPGRVLARVNDELLTLGLDDCQFVAGLYAVFDEQTGVIRLARGGTPYPVLLSETNEVRVIQSGGPILGAMADPTFEVAEFVLAPRERLFVYTDGVEPLIGADSDVKSVGSAWEHLVGQCRSGRTISSSSVSTDTILASLNSRASVEQTRRDDVTVLTIERLPQS